MSTEWITSRKGELAISEKEFEGMQYSVTHLVTNPKRFFISVSDTKVPANIKLDCQVFNNGMSLQEFIITAMQDCLTTYQTLREHNYKLPDSYELNEEKDYITNDSEILVFYTSDSFTLESAAPLILSVAEMLHDLYDFHAKNVDVWVRTQPSKLMEMISEMDVLSQSNNWAARVMYDVLEKRSGKSVKLKVK